MTKHTQLITLIRYFIIIYTNVAMPIGCIYKLIRLLGNTFKYPKITRIKYRISIIEYLLCILYPIILILLYFNIAHKNVITEKYVMRG